MKIYKSLVTCVAIASLLGTAIANAQWVIVAKKVSGKVQQMSSKSANGPGYDVAMVVLEANADKVYQTAVKALSTHEGITVLKEDPTKREIDFTNGTQEASLQAQALGDKLSQLVIASALTGTAPPATSMVLQGVMKVCKDMNVTCTEQSK